MKIAVLGATGRTGRLVVEQALTRGDEVVAYVRNPHGIAANPGSEIAVGQLGVGDTARTAELIARVVSTLVNVVYRADQLRRERPFNLQTHRQAF
jgi:putative NADH-flavin reductase